MTTQKKGMNLRAMIKSFFTAHPQRKNYKSEYIDNMHEQCRRLHRPMGFIVIFVWIGFALDTDPKLHPEFVELPFLRFGLSFVGLVTFIVSFFKKIQGKGMFWLLTILVYVTLCTGFLTGRLADDPNYVSGYQIVLLLITIAPIPRKYSYILIASSLFIFAIAVAIYAPDLSTKAAAYSMNNLVVAIILSIAILYFLEGSRFRIFLNHIIVSEQKAEVEALKIKQDGDYYLTSILLNPLMINENKSNIVNIEFLFNQYKKFEFREHKAEIGGDLCSAHSIELHGRKYTIFINGDAMGKSIQGAGGALVLGTVYNALVARTHSTKAAEQKYPEQWLKECFLELQNVFVSFDGSMLISAVFGLVDEESGLVYYINAEHPWIVLYRDGKASFIENELYLRKIGIEGITGKLQIKTFQMQRADVLICGSDGRDDILLGVSEDGSRIINEDETEFLTHVENGNGRLTEIQSVMQQAGHLTDDLTLLRIEFDQKKGGQKTRTTEFENSVEEGLKAKANGNVADATLHFTTAFNIYPGDPVLASDLYNLLLKTKDYDKLQELCEKYCSANPQDSEFLYLTSYVLKLQYGATKKRALLGRAADFGERYLLRNSKMFKNLINLVDIYRILGIDERAHKLLSEAKKIDSGHKKVKVIEELLAKKKSV